MLIKTLFAGFGGQGVLSMGLNLAQAAMREGTKQIMLALAELLPIEYRGEYQV